MKNILLTLGACSVFGAQAAERHPNIVLIMADDLGWNDLACTGSRFYETPNIDRLAAQGVRFEHSYAACQVSSPSRASLLTGKTPARHGITNWIGEESGEAWREKGRNSKLLPAQYKHGLPTTEITLPKRLKEYGYTTFIAGKWHVGGDDSTPQMHGFDINIGGYHAGSPRGGYFSPYKNPKLTDGKPGENLTMRLASETNKFIAEHLQKHQEQPFFALLSFYAVHGPIQTTQQKWAYYRDKAQQQGIADTGFVVDRTLPVRQHQDNPIYAGLVEQMDQAVGLVMEQIERSGVADNTIVIFTSDNGGVSSGDAYSTSCLPLRGGKGRQWEGGLRVPFIIKYSGCEAGSTLANPIITMDIYPTLLDMVGIPSLPEQHADGISLYPALQGEQTSKRTLFWHYPHYGNQGGEPSSVIRDGVWKLIHYHEDSHDELYNLAIDESESETLNAQYPEKARELGEKLKNWLLSVEAKMPQPDPLYDPLTESRFKSQRTATLLPMLEQERSKQLTPGWSPNADWWKSKITTD